MRKKKYPALLAVLAAAGVSLALAGCGQDETLHIPASSGEASQAVSSEESRPAGTGENPSQGSESGDPGVTQTAVLYIGMEGSQQEYPLEYTGELTPEVLIQGIAETTGWDLTLADAVTTGKRRHDGFLQPAVGAVYRAAGAPEGGIPYVQFGTACPDDPRQHQGHIAAEFCGYSRRWGSRFPGDLLLYGRRPAPDDPGPGGDDPHGSALHRLGFGVYSFRAGHNIPRSGGRFFAGLLQSVVVCGIMDRYKNDVYGEGVIHR